VTSLLPVYGFYTVHDFLEAKSRLRFSGVKFWVSGLAVARSRGPDVFVALEYSGAFSCHEDVDGMHGPLLVFLGRAVFLPDRGVERDRLFSVFALRPFPFLPRPSI